MIFIYLVFFIIIYAFIDYSLHLFILSLQKLKIVSLLGKQRIARFITLTSRREKVYGTTLVINIIKIFFKKRKRKHI